MGCEIVLPASTSANTRSGLDCWNNYSSGVDYENQLKKQFLTVLKNLPINEAWATGGALQKVQ